MKVLILEGWPASGKTALWAMLDGLDKVFVEPLHTYWFEMIFKLFENENEERILTIREFRNALTLTEYYKTEQYSVEGVFPVSYGVGKQKNHLFKFNFYRFDLELVSQICNGKIKTALEVVEIYSRLYLKYYSMNYSDIDLFVSMSNYHVYNKNLQKKFPNLFKVVVVQRSEIEIFASRIGRKPRAEDGKFITTFSPSWKKLRQESEIEEILTFDKYYKIKEKSFPNYYKIISLIDLLNEKEKAMYEICDFIGLQADKIFLTGTRDKLSLKYNDINLTDRVNDNHKIILNKLQIMACFFRKAIWCMHKRPVNIFSSVAIIRYIYFYLRKIR